MKSKAAIRREFPIALVIAAAAALQAQTADNWTTLSPLPTPNGYSEFSVRGPDILVAGNAGTLVRSRDGGNSWAREPSGTRLHLRAACQGSDGTSFAAGDSGVILRSSGPGQPWVRLNSGTRLGFRSIATPDGKAVYAAGEKGILLRSLDAGVNWTPLVSGATDTLHSIRAFPEGKVMGSFGGGINAPVTQCFFISSVDQGETWSSPLQAWVRNLASLDGITVYGAHDRGDLLKSTDAGRSWTRCLIIPAEFGRFSLGEDGTLAAMSSEYLKRNHAWVSLDGGATWDEDTLPYDTQMKLLPLGDGKVMAFTSRGYRYRHSQGVWEGPGGPGLHAGGGVAAANAEAAWVVGNNRAQFVLRSGEPGTSTVFPSDHVLDAVAASGRDTVYAGGKRSVLPNTGILLRSYDRGKTWVELDVTGTGSIRALQAVDGRTLFVAGHTQLRTTLDGGTTWRTFGVPGVGGLDFIAAVSPRIAFACCSEENKMLRTSDSGASWEAVGNRIVNPVFALTASGADALFAVLYDDSFRKGIRKSADGGATWIPVTIPGNPPIETIHSPVGRPNLILATSYWGRFFATLDGGKTWSSEDMGFEGSIKSLSYGGGESVFSTGTNDAVLVRSAGSLTLRLSGGPVRLGARPRARTSGGYRLDGTWSAGIRYDSMGRIDGIGVARTGERGRTILFPGSAR